MSKTNYALNTNEFLLQKLLHQNVLCYIKRKKKKNNNFYFNLSALLSDGGVCQSAWERWVVAESEWHSW